MSQTPSLSPNLGTRDRLFRVTLGLALICWGLWQGSLALILGGLFAIAEATLSWCIFYQLIGKNTCPLPNRRWPSRQWVLRPLSEGLQFSAVIIALMFVMFFFTGGRKMRGFGEYVAPISMTEANLTGFFVPFALGTTALITVAVFSVRFVELAPEYIGVKKGQRLQAVFGAILTGFFAICMFLLSAVGGYYYAHGAGGSGPFLLGGLANGLVTGSLVWLWRAGRMTRENLKLVMLNLWFLPAFLLGLALMGLGDDQMDVLVARYPGLWFFTLGTLAPIPVWWGLSMVMGKLEKW